jgi:hypothetical protein
LHTQQNCHPEQSEGPAVVFAVAFLSVIPEGNLLFGKNKDPTPAKASLGFLF